MGVRFAVTGGREGWARTVLTALGVGLGVALLLTAAAVPDMLTARDARDDARSGFGAMEELKPGPETIRIGQADTEYHGKGVRGLILRPDGDRAPVPPGLGELPGPGEMLVSPALAELLGSPGGKLLKERLDSRVTGIIGKEGLLGPSELVYYAGADAETLERGHSYRIDHWGVDEDPEPLPPELLLLVIIGCVVLLLPVALFIGTAVRFGGERRDRRLAALRLVGADSRMTRRIAAGESLSGALLGLLVGGALFLLLRQFIGTVTLWDLSVHPSDVRPSAALTALIAPAVPASAIGVTLLALRGVAIEPLGVVRNAVPRRRRLWWRLLLPALGLGLLLPMAGDFGGGDSGSTYRAAGGAVLLLVGVTAVLPWLVETVVNRFTGGPLAWQLATRRLQLSSGTAARAVSGITIAVAGAIAVQMLFTAVEASSTEASGQDPARAQMQVSVPVKSGPQARDVIETFRATPGVAGVIGLTQSYVGNPARGSEEAAIEALTIGDCATLRELVRIGGDCADGDVFVTEVTEDWQFSEPGTEVDLAPVEEDRPAGEPSLWTVPDTARVVDSRTDPLGSERTGIFVTPSALDAAALRDAEALAMVKLDPGEPEAAEHVRNTASAISPAISVFALSSVQESPEFAGIRRGLFIGATATLLLIGASMIVSTLEQLRERRRLLSVLIAFGTRRATLGWSVFWQTAVPVVLGLALAVAGGVGLGAVLLKLTSMPMAVDWWSLATMTGIGGGVILLVTALSLPPLWRMMRPGGIRTE
ncbi:MAG TPA: hypothetical protein DEQ61_03015 [Streptomyces sp.]|nr:hypothetical protein [Streptomyces sp.]